MTVSARVSARSEDLNQAPLINVDNGTLSLEQPSNVLLKLSPDQIGEVVRQGDDLIVTLSDGQVLRITDFYGYGETATSQLYLLGEDNQLYLADLGVAQSNGLLVADYIPLDDSSGLLALAGDTAGGGGLSAAGIAAIAAGVGVAGAVAAGSGGGGGGGNAPDDGGNNGGGGDAPDDGGNDGGEGNGGDTLPPSAPTLSLATDTGADTDDGITGDPTVNVSGLEANATWEYSTDGGTTWATGTGTSFELPAGSCADGAIQVRQTDSAGNTSPVGNLGAITIDLSAPAAPVVNPTDGEIVTGTAEAGSTVTLTDGDGNPIGSTTTDANGNWSFQPGTPLADGSAVNAVATDAAGNASAPTSATVEGDLNDTTPPAAPTLTTVSDDVTPQTGALASGDSTNDTTPRFTGRAEAGSTVTVYANGDAIGTTSADTQGNWSFTPDALAQGDYDFTFTATDSAGNDSPASAPFTLTVDTQPPAAPVVNPTDGEIVTGTAEAGSTVTLTDGDGNPIGSTTTDANGNWSFQPGTALADGSAVNAVATDAAGNASAPTSATVEGDLNDTTPPAAPTLTTVSDDVTPQTGALASGDSTNDTTPRFTGRAEAGSTVTVYANGNAIGTTSTDAQGNWSFTPDALAQGDYDFTFTATDSAGNDSPASAPFTLTVDTQPPAAPVVNPTDGEIVTGTAEAGSTVTLTDGDDNELATVNVDRNGNWSYAPDTPLADGSTVTAVATDAAGNASDPGSATVDSDLVDNRPPADPVIITSLDTEAPITGEVGDGGTTNDTMPTLIGTAEATNRVQLWADSGSGMQMLGETQADNFGNWSFRILSRLASGNTTFRALSFDPTGQTSQPSGPFAINVDTTPPDAPSIDTVVDDVSPAGDLASGDISNDNTPALSGSAEPGSSISVFAGGVLLGNTMTDAEGNWSFTPDALADGSYDFTVTATDAAGNTSQESAAFSLNIDATAPTAPTISLATDTGADIADGITNDATVTVDGLEANATWEYSTDGGTTWTTGTGTSFELGDGTYADGDVQVRQTDVAGNVSPVDALGPITVDLSDPLTPTISLATDTGADITDGITNDATVTVDDLEANAAWEYSTDGGTTWAAGTGTSIELAEGAYADGAVQVRQTDVAGNVSPVDALGPITVDLSAPTAPTVALQTDSGIDTTDGITNDATVTVDGLEANATWEYSTDGGTTWTAGTGTSFELGEGTYADGAVQVRQTDIAGNTSPVGNLGPVVVNLSAPTAPTLSLATDTGADITDGITNDATVTVDGLEANATWEYSTDGGTTWTTGTGTSFELSEGTYADGAVQVRQTDIAGNVSPVDTLGPITVDLSEPLAPTISLTNDTGADIADGITNDATVNVDGLEANATWEYSTDAGTTWTAGTGTSFELGEGTYADGAVQVRQTDIAGNTSPVGNLGPVVVDISAPAAPTISLVTDTGADIADGITNDATVTVDGLEANAIWEYSTDAGTTWTTGTGTSFELGEGTYADGDVQVRQNDVAGNTSPVDSLGPVVVNLSAPTAPTLSLATDTGADITDGITNDATVTVDGLEANATWEYSTDGGTTWTTGTGNSFELGEGTYADGDVQVRQTDIAGNTSLVGNLGRVVVDLSAPTAPTLSLANDTGADITDGITNDATVNVEDLEANATWEYSTDGGTTWTTGTGTSFELGEGTYADGDVQVRQTDVAGNTSLVGNLGPVVVDLSAPAAPTISLATDTGADITDGITNDATVTVDGLEANATWEYSTDGGTTWTTGTGTSFDLDEGTYSDGDVQVRQTDVAGNISTIDSLGPITVDLSAPVAPTISLASDTGADIADGITNDATVTVDGLEANDTWEYSTDAGTTWTTGTGTSFELAEGTYADGDVQVRQTDIAGNTSPVGNLGPVVVDLSAPLAPTISLATDTGADIADGITNDATVNVDGLEANATWEYSTDAGTTWTTGTGTSFELGEGTYADGDVQVRQTDVAGNISPVDALGPITVDLSAPLAPTISLATDTGADIADGITNDATVNVDGLEANATWEYSTDGGTTWTTGTGTSFELGEGTYADGDVQVRQTDVAGNVSPADALGPITVDLSAPTAPTLSLATDTGADIADGITNDATVTVDGLEANATWEYSTDAGTTWTTGTGTSFELGEGTYADGDVQVRQTDVAGNVSPVDALGPITIDLSAPTAPTLSLATDTGADIADGITNDATVTVDGLEANATWEYSTDGGTTWTTGTGTSFELDEGTYADGDVQVRQTDVAGNVSPIDSLGPITVDLSAPLAPTISLATDTGADIADGITNDATVNVDGLEANATWEYSTDAGTTWTTGTGTSFELGEGTYADGDVQVRQTDVAGNVGPVDALGPITVDLSAPVAPTISLATDTGADIADGITNDATVTVDGLEANATWEYSTDGGTTWTTGTGTSFELAEGTYADGDVQVRQTDVAGNSSVGNLDQVTIDLTPPPAPTIDPTNGQIITGSAEPNSTITLTDGDETFLGEVTANANGDWSFQPATPLADATQVQATATDVAGNIGGTDSQNVDVDLDDTTPPPTPMIDFAVDDVDPVGNLANGDSTNDTTPTLRGSAEASSTVTIFLGGIQLDTVIADDTGNWSYTPAALGEGNYDFTVTATDAAGNTSQESAPFSLSIDLSAPLAPTISLATDTGADIADGITNDATVNVDGLEANATWEYSTDGGTTWTTGTGTSFELGEGTYADGDVQVRQTDIAGNVSPVDALGPITVDLSAPVAPTISLANDTGADIADGITNDATVNIDGLEANATWEYSTDGGTTWTTGAGTSFELGEGTYADGDVQVRQTDVAGNISPVDSLGPITVDLSAPTAPTLSLATDTGADIADGITNDATVTIDGLEANATWEYSTDGDTTWTTGTGASFELDEGTYADGDVQVRQTDIAGNTSLVGDLGPVVVDLSAPLAPTISLASDTGADIADGITNDATVTVDGLEANATWEYSTDGGNTWSAGTGASFELAEGTYADGDVQVRQTDVAGNISPVDALGPITVDLSAPLAPTVSLATDTGADIADGITNDATVTVDGLEANATWEYSTDAGTTWTTGTGTSFELGEGTYADGDVQVRQTDVAGNVSPVDSLGPVVVDLSAPTAPTLSLATDTGADIADGITNDATVTVDGLEANATWEYSTDGGNTWSAGTGASFELAEGTYADGDVQVRQTDVAGNVSPADALGPITVDLSAPTAPTLSLANDTGADITDGITNDATVNVDGLEANATWEYSTDAGTTWTTGTGTSFELGEGTYADGAVQVRQTDVAGNTSLVGDLGPVVVDLSAPTAPTISLVNDTGVDIADGITNDATVNVDGLEANATWEYSTDGGNTWSAGTGASFELDEGTYADGDVQVRQTDIAGNTSPVDTLGPITVDLSEPLAPTISLATDTGADITDGITNDATVTVDGLEANATWEYSTDGGTTWTTGTGTSFELGEGTYADGDVQVRQTDVAGNVSPVDSLGPVVVDLSAPIAPTLSLATDTGADIADGITNDATVSVDGLEANATWEYSTDGDTTWTTGTGTSFELGEGTYADGDVQVRQTDVAGNVSPVGNLGRVVVDLSAPLAPTISLATDTGADIADGITNDATVTVDDLEANATWEYSTDAGITWTTGTGTSFELGEGTYADDDVQVRQTDVAGNTSPVDSLGPVVVDLSAPTAPTLSLATDTGADIADGITNDATVTVDGLEANATWEYSTDGGTTWTTGTGTSFELGEGAYADGAVQVRQTDIAGNTSLVGNLGPAVVDLSAPTAPTISLATDTGADIADGITNDATVTVDGLEANVTWEYSTDGGTTWTTGTGTSFELGEGTYADGDVQVRQSDVAGNVSPVDALGPITVDLSAPTAPTLSLATDTGADIADGITNDATVTVDGLEPNTTWEYSTDGGATWTTGTGTSFELGEGTYADGAVQVRQTDIAGNTSPVGNLGPVVVDLSAPTAPTISLATDTGADITDGITNDATVNVDGLEANATWEYSTDAGTTWTTGTGASFELGEGTYADGAVQVRQTDVAGNISPVGNLGPVQVDLTAPTVEDTAVPISESELFFVPAITTTGTLDFATGSGVGELDISAPSGITSAGVSVSWSLTENNGTYRLSGSAGGAEVAVLEITSDGSYTFTQSRPFDHLAAGADVLSLGFDIAVTDLTGNLGSGTLTFDVEDATPTAAADQVFGLGTEGTSASGTLVASFGADGGYVQSLGIGGYTLTYDPDSASVTTSGSDTFALQQSFDADSGQLTIEIGNAETLIVDMTTGEYQYGSVALGSAPQVSLDPSNDLLGLVGVDAVGGLVSNSSNQAFQVSDPDNDTTRVAINTATGSLLGLNIAVGNASLAFTYSQTLAQALGVDVQLTSNIQQTTVLGIRIISSMNASITLTGLNGGTISNQQLNALLSTVRLEQSGVNILSLTGSSLSLSATDAAGNTSTTSDTSGLNVDLLTGSGGGAGSIIDPTATAGDDVLVVASASGSLSGGEGNDWLLGGTGANTLIGGAGNDVVIGGRGNDTLTGGAGNDTFLWQSGDAGSVGAAATDTITDFSAQPVRGGGDRLDLRGLLEGGRARGTTAGNLTSYLFFALVGGTTVLYVSSEGAFADGITEASAQAQADQVIRIEGSDLVGEFGANQAAIINNLLANGNLLVNRETVDSSAELPDQTVVDATVVDGDGDTDTTTVTVDRNSTDSTSANAPIVQADDGSLLGLLGVEALGIIDLDQQSFIALDPDNDLRQVEITYQALAALSLGSVAFTYSTAMAQAFGYQVNVETGALAGVLVPNTTITITARDGGTLDNLEINEFLATLQLDTGSLDLAGLNLDAGLSALGSFTVAATDISGTTTADAAGNLVSLQAINRLLGLDGSDFLLEGGSGNDVLNAADSGQRLYGYAGNDTLNGGDGNDLLNAGSGNNVLNGGAGNDLLIGGNGADTLDGGTGDDTIVVSGNAFASVDGGDGFDTLVLDGGIDLDMIAGGIGSIGNIERLDLGSGDGSSRATLSAQNVLDMTDDDNVLQITGDEQDTLSVQGATLTGSVTLEGTAYDQYTFGDATLQVEHNTIVVET
ncbi:Ig-like domain-containing protein [Salinicola sp. DM10]|uniref:Ig-like domain-containing protein n=1 Tax=Salinicola sp. DM10 TaxID=2815721 RepID=UPI001E4C6F58|nr:Ig-like domain-containing protein [Salinicola sp. DM10]MCE3026333.1 Ig-like domain-containing protein [Salinicola sp. DM10]